MRKLLLLTCLLIWSGMSAQSIAPVVDAVRFNAKSEAEMNAFTRAEEGTVCYREDTDSLWRYNGTTWAEVSGGGDVSAAAAFGTDNRIIRSDGTGKGVQSSSVSINDEGSVTNLFGSSSSTWSPASLTFFNAIDATNEDIFRLERNNTVGEDRGYVISTSTSNTLNAHREKLWFPNVDSNSEGGPDNMIAKFYGRVSGADAQAADEFVTRGQVGTFAQLDALAADKPLANLSDNQTFTGEVTYTGNVVIEDGINGMELFNAVNVNYIDTNGGGLVIRTSGSENAWQFSNTGNLTGGAGNNLVVNGTITASNLSGTNTGDQNAAGVSIADAGALITATDVEGALAENRTAINLNTAKVGVTDGDKGDITVSGSGATWSVDSGAIASNEITYDNTASGLTATDVKAAIDEVAAAAGTTDLSYTPSATNGTVNSSTGTDAVLTLATGTNAGLQSPANFTKQSISIVSDVTGLTGADAVTNVVSGTQAEIDSWSADAARLAICTDCKTPEVIQIACSDLTTDITTGTSKAYFRMPWAATLTDVRVSLLTAGTTTGITVDINESGVSVLGTKLTTDATEKTSETAATAHTITDSTLADDAEITIDFDAVPTGGKGVIVTLYVEY